VDEVAVGGSSRAMGLDAAARGPAVKGAGHQDAGDGADDEAPKDAPEFAEAGDASGADGGGAHDEKNAHSGSGETHKGDKKEPKKGKHGKGNDEVVFNQTGDLLPPPITSAGFMALLVVALLLLIFIPGIMALFNIQTPYAFDTPDKDGGKKKTQ